MYSSIPFSSSHIDWTRLNYFNSYPFIQNLYTKPLENYDGDVNVTILAAQLDLDALQKKQRRKRQLLSHLVPKPSTFKPNPCIASTYLSMEDVSDSEIQTQRECLIKEAQRYAQESNIPAEEKPDALPLNEPINIQNIEEIKYKSEMEKNKINVKCNLQLKIKQLRLLHHCIKKWHHKLLSFFQILHQYRIYRDWKTKQIHFNYWLLKFRKIKNQREEKCYQKQLALDQARSKQAEMFIYKKRLSDCWRAWIVYMENEKFTRQMQDRYVQLQFEKEKAKTKNPSSLQNTNALLKVVETKKKQHKKESSLNSLNSSTLKQSSNTVTTKMNCSNPSSMKGKPTLSLPIPPFFLQRMQEREEARKQRKLERLKRKEEFEVQKELEKKEKERLAVLQEEERKREKKMKEKEMKEAQERWKLYCVQQEKQAYEFDTKRKMKQAIQKWKCRMLKNEKINNLAVNKYLAHIWKKFKKNYFLFLSNGEQDALHFRHTFLKKRCLRSLKKTFMKYQMKLNQAEAFYAHHCLKLSVVVWKERAKVSAIFSAEKLQKDLQKADKFSVKVLLRWYFYEWRMNIKLIKNERWREYRKNLLRKKLRECLVDSSLEKLCNSTTIETCLLLNSDESSNKNRVNDWVQPDNTNQQLVKQTEPS